ncbi:MAG: hypothetical protein KTR24_08035 [Saprospiraceae bacterium]|nr:hypothetical protein [Saprospiraceae bacterium]
MDSWLAEWNKLEIRSRFPVTIISAEAMQKVSSLKTSSAVLIECDIPSPVLVDGAKRVVFLDRINNPGNLGTILRCCDWFGVEQLILSPESADLYNPKTVQACMGSLGRIPIYYATAGQMATLRPAFRNFYAVLDAAPVQSLVDLKEWMLCIGSESHGLSQETLSLPGTKVSIPKMTNSSIDSLNAAVAAGILISQFVEIS